MSWYDLPKQIWLWLSKTFLQHRMFYFSLALPKHTLQAFKITGLSLCVFIMSYTCLGKSTLWNQFAYIVECLFTNYLVVDWVPLQSFDFLFSFKSLLKKNPVSKSERNTQHNTCCSFSIRINWWIIQKPLTGWKEVFCYWFLKIDI